MFYSLGTIHNFSLVHIFGMQRRMLDRHTATFVGNSSAVSYFKI